MRITKYRTEIDNKINILVKEETTNYDISSISSPSIIADMLNDVYRLNKQAEEYIYLIALNTKNKIIGVFEVSHGTVGFSLVSPREIFIRALLVGASNIILAHNHPSGELEPSADDIKTTNRVAEAGKLIGIQLLDHIICGLNEYRSLKICGYL